MSIRSRIWSVRGVFLLVATVVLMPAVCGSEAREAGTVPAATLPASYSEPFRPQFHFTPAKNWINDPNGLVYFDGEYHLFFQYNPQGDKWGHLSWGHAVSRDLMHWEELPVAIPEDDRYMIFSGSAVVDARNTSGFGKPDDVPLVAIYTGAQRPAGAIQNQQLAYSTDRGRNWTKYAGNPVLDLGLKSFRDPKVFWYAPNHYWVMATVLADRHQVALFSSPDLKQWTHLSDFGPAGATDGAWECPDLFALPVNGDPADMRWVLKVDVFRSAVAAGSGTQYFIGRFDGSTFTPDSDPAFAHIAAPAHWLDYGMDFYAAASWANLPDARRRHLWIGWMNNPTYAQEIPTAPWRGAMSLPRELSLRSESGAMTLLQAPVKELTVLRGSHQHLAAMTLHAMSLRDPPYRIPLPAGFGKAVEIVARFAPRSAQEFGLMVNEGPGEQTLIGYDKTLRSLFIDRSKSGQIPAAAFAVRHSAPLVPRDGLITLHVFVDWSSVEVFANDGERVMTEQVFAAPASDGILLYAKGGEASLKSLDVWELNSTGRAGL